MHDKNGQPVDNHAYLKIPITHLGKLNFNTAKKTRLQIITAEVGRDGWESAQIDPRRHRYDAKQNLPVTIGVSE